MPTTAAAVLMLFFICRTGGTQSWCRIFCYKRCSAWTTRCFLNFLHVVSHFHYSDQKIFLTSWALSQYLKLGLFHLQLSSYLLSECLDNIINFKCSMSLCCVNNKAITKDSTSNQLVVIGESKIMLTGFHFFINFCVSNTKNL